MKTILSAAIGAMLALSAVKAGAQAKAAERKVEIAIEQQSLADALNEWAKQTGLQLVSQSSEKMNTTVPPRLKGEYTAQGALDELLKGTTLTYEWVSERAVAIREKPLVVPAALQTSGVDQKQAPVPVARFSGEAWGERRVAANDQGTSGETSASDRGTESATEDLEEVEEIIVTGTHIRGIDTSVAPVLVLDREYIESTGLSTTSGLIASLPQNFALANQSVIDPRGVSSTAEQGTAINLRGLGEGTTLVLLNGRRIAPGFVGSAVDISALPLTAIERIDVLTDGASALYGSDAVGGVVNFVLRRDFDGAETRVRAGEAAGGINEYRVGQSIGHSWSSGGALVSGEFYKRDLLPTTARSFAQNTTLVGSLAPSDKNYSGIFSGHQRVGDSLTLFADAVYSTRKTFNRGGSILDRASNESTNDQSHVALGGTVDIGEAWVIETVGSYSRNALDQTQHLDSLEEDFLVNTKFTVRDVHAKADGPVLALPGGDVRIAAGLEWRSDELNDGSPSVASQIVRSAFGELYVPIVGVASSMPGAKRLSLSLSGRYDDYSNFGNAFTPKVGLLWQPTDRIKLRGSYGESFVAPKLTDYSTVFNATLALLGPDPASPTGVSNYLSIGGIAADELTAQKSRNLLLDLEFSPAWIPGLRFQLGYFDIRYRNQISGLPDPSEMVAREQNFPDLVVRDPTNEQVSRGIALGEQGLGFFYFDPDFNLLPMEDFDPDSIDVLIDSRRRNLSVVKTSGMDFSTQLEVDSNLGTFMYLFGGTYIRELARQVSVASPEFDVVDTIQNPPHLRFRGGLSWTNREWSTTVFLNHTADYHDSRLVPPAPIASYTTVDARVAYDASRSTNHPIFSGFLIALSAQNLLNRDPPRTAVLVDGLDLGFDPTNASPMGRLVALEVVKRW